MEKQFNEIKNKKGDEIPTSDLRDINFFNVLSSAEAYKDIDNLLNILRNGNYYNKDIEQAICIKALDSALYEHREKFIHKLNNGIQIYRCRVIGDMKNAINEGVGYEDNGEKVVFSRIRCNGFSRTSAKKSFI